MLKKVGSVPESADFIKSPELACVVGLIARLQLHSYSMDYKKDHVNTAPI